MKEIISQRRNNSKVEALHYLKKNLPPIHTIVDIGAKKQTPSLKSCFPKCKHILVEPVKEFCQKLAINYKDINCKIYEKAASDKTGFENLSITSNFGENITHSTLTETPDSSMNIRQVETITVDEIYSEEKIEYNKSLLKIDVDGNEMKILKGATESLNNISILIIEVSIYDLFNITTFLAEYNIFAWDMCDMTYYKNKLVQFDMICLNKAHINLPKINPWKDGDFDLNDWEIRV